MIHEYSRTELLIGKQSMEKLKNATVMVFGIGGVGSHCTEALARSGVGHLILIDNDRVSLTNINRQSIAFHSTVGRMKTDVMKEMIADINPEIRTETREIFVLPENAEQLFEEFQPDYIIDAIDTVSAKIALAVIAEKRNIRMISSMGTGNKLHPERFEIADLSATSVCPLCRVMRKELRDRGIMHLKVLYSREKPVPVNAADSAEETGVRRAVPGSISFVPPVAGLLIAGEVIRELAEIKENG